MVRVPCVLLEGCAALSNGGGPMGEAACLCGSFLLCPLPRYLFQTDVGVGGVRGALRSIESWDAILGVLWGSWGPLPLWEHMCWRCPVLPAGGRGGAPFRPVGHIFIWFPEANCLGSVAAPFVPSWGDSLFGVLWVLLLGHVYMGLPLGLVA